MKIIKMFSKSEFLVEDDEAEIVAKNFGSGQLIKLRSGNYISTAGIESIGDLELIPYWDGYMLDKGERSFMRDGQRIYLETKDFEKIEYKPHPKYKIIEKITLDKVNSIKKLN